MPKPSKLAERVAKLHVEGDKELELAIDEVLRPVRECLEKTDQLLRLYGYNMQRKDIWPILKDMEVSK